MCLGGNLWFKRLIVVLPFLLFSNLILAENVSWYLISAFYGSNSKGSNTAGYDFSKCDASKLAFNVEAGNPDSPRDDQREDTTDDYIMVTYGARWEPSKRSGIWKYAQGVMFRAPNEFRAPIIAALKKALAQGNCQAARDLSNGLINGQRCEADSSAYCFARPNPDGSRNACVVKSDGSSRCKVQTGQTEETNPDGTPRIKIDCAAGEDCRKDTDLDGYANLPDTKTDDGDSGTTDDGKIKEHRGEGGSSGEQGGDGKHNEGDKGISGGSGSSGPDKRGNTSDKTGKVGSGMANNGKSPDTKTENDSDKQGGQDNSNTDKTGDSNVKDSDKDGNGKGSSGDGNGSGGGGGSAVGNGKGDGEGDGKDDGKKEGSDVDFPALQEFDVKSAISELKDGLKNKLGLDGLSISGGSCPSFNITVFGKSQSITIHCQILDSNGGAISAAFLFIWGFAAIRIFLSA